MKTMFMGLIFFAVIFVRSEAIADSKRRQRLAVSQGISSPTVTSPVNFSHGFTYTNAAAASQLNDISLSLEADTSEEEDSSRNRSDDTGYGAELGVGTGNAGIALGYYTRDCEDCDGRFGGIAGVGGDTVAVGVGFREEDNYSAGFLFNPKGRHRFGLAADMFNSDLDDADVRSYGAGYSYVGNSFVFAVDASKKDFDGPTNSREDVIMITPGLEVHSDWLALSVSYDNYLSDDNDIYDDDIWFGVGIQGKDWNLAIYHDYVNEWSTALTFWF